MKSKTHTTNLLVQRIRLEAERPGGPDPEEVRALLADVLSDHSDWLEDQYQELGEGDYSLYPLYRAENGRCSLLAVVVRPGKPLPIHNHGSWAVIGVYRGRERDTWFRRLDDGGEPGRARLERDCSFVNDMGTVSVVPDGKIHTVEALESTVAVSLHVYATDIVTQVRSTFDLAAGTEEIFQPEFKN